MGIKSYRIEEMPKQLPAEQVQRLQEVEAATVGHYSHDRFMDAALRPVIEGRRIAGTAVTVSIPGPDSTLIYYAMDRVRPGDVLVVDRCGDRRHACWGGFMAAVARQRGLAGVMIDGLVTDPSEMRREGVPTWARGVTAITTKLLNLGGTFNLPVNCGGVAVKPGDAVLADECGIVVISPAELAEVIDVALADQAEEGHWLGSVRAGKPLKDLVDVEAMMRERMQKDAGGHG